MYYVSIFHFYANTASHPWGVTKRSLIPAAGVIFGYRSAGMFSRQTEAKTKTSVSNVAHPSGFVWPSVFHKRIKMHRLEPGRQEVGNLHHIGKKEKKEPEGNFCFLF